MELKILAGFPRVCDQSSSELCFSLVDNELLVIVYEARRDFLSTPRSFIEIQARLDSQRIVCTGGLLMDVDEFEFLLQQDFAAYEVVDKTAQPNADESNTTALSQRYVLHSPNCIFECYAISFELKKTHYHRPSSRAVLSLALREFDEAVN